MAPKKLNKHFSKFPPEIKLRIFSLSMEPRIVRGQWESVVVGDSYKAIYQLSCGPVPKILHINRESRFEALKSYTLVKSRAALTESAEKRFQKDNDHSIYINFDIDTIYFVNFPDTHSFLSWMRRIPRELKMPSSTTEFRHNYVEKRVKHIAFNSDMPVAWTSFECKLDVWYGMVFENPGLQTITVVFGNNSFASSKFPHTFAFKVQPEKVWKKYPKKKTVQGEPATPAKPAMPTASTIRAMPAMSTYPAMPATPLMPAMPAVLGTPPKSVMPVIKPAIPLKPGQPSKSTNLGTLPPINYAVQVEPEARWVPVSWVKHITVLCNDFFEKEKSETMGTTYGRKFRAWRETDVGKAWIPPKFEMMSISIARKKHVRGG